MPKEWKVKDTENIGDSTGTIISFKKLVGAAADQEGTESQIVRMKKSITLIEKYKNNDLDPIIAYLSSGSMMVDGRKTLFLTYSVNINNSTIHEEKIHKMIWTTNPWQAYSIELTSTTKHFPAAQKIFDRIVQSITFLPGMHFSCDWVINKRNYTDYKCEHGYALTLPTQHNLRIDWQSISYDGEVTPKLGPLNLVTTFTHISKEGNGDLQISVAKARIAQRNIDEDALKKAILEKRQMMILYFYTRPALKQIIRKSFGTTTVEFRRAGPWFFAFIFTKRPDVKNAEVIYKSIMDSLKFDPDISLRR